MQYGYTWTFALRRNNSNRISAYGFERSLIRNINAQGCGAHLHPAPKAIAIRYDQEFVLNYKCEDIFLREHHRGFNDGT